MGKVFQDEKDRQRQLTLLKVYDRDLQRLERRVGRDRAASSYIRQRQVRNTLAAFIAQERHCTDVDLADLDETFIRDFAFWLGVERGQLPGTVWLSCQMLKGLVARACQQGLLARNPFAGFRVGRNIRPREFLTEQELGRLMACNPPKPQWIVARDLFIFAALTGMSFVDIKELRLSDITELNGEQWIQTRRHKTGVPFQVRLVQPAIDIVRRYAGQGEHVFHRLNYRTLASQVPKLMEACGFSKHITFHCARHTFAVMALNAGMPIESVSRVLGHSSITTTQIYAKITMQKLSHDMELFDQSLTRRLTDQ